MIDLVFYFSRFGFLFHLFWFSVLVCFLCLGCFSFYAFWLRVSLFLFTVFMCLRALGCFRSIVCFRFVLGIVCEGMPRLLMGDVLIKNCSKRTSRK